MPAMPHPHDAAAAGAKPPLPPPPRRPSGSDEDSDAMEPASRMLPRRRPPRPGPGAAAAAAAEEPVWPAPRPVPAAPPGGGGGDGGDGGDGGGGVTNMFEAARALRAARRREGQAFREHSKAADFALDSGGGGEASEDEDEESEVVASSFFHGSKPAFTKLEVMSSDRIRNVINFFHIFVALGFILTLGQLIGANVAYRERTPVAVQIPVPGLFSEALFRSGVAEEVQARRELFAKSPPPDAGGSATPSVRQPVRNSLLPGGGADLAGALAARRLYKCSQFVLCDACTRLPADIVATTDARAAFPGDIYAAPAAGSPPPRPADCGGAGSVPLSFSQTKPGQEACAELLAQETPCCVTGTSPNGKAILAPSCPKDGGATDAGGGGGGGGATTVSDQPKMPALGESEQVWDAHKRELADWLIANGRGPDDPNPASYMTMDVINADEKYLVAVHSTMLAFSLLTTVLAVVYIVRIVRLGRSRITHEQIWVAVLLVMAALYWNAVDSLNRIDRTMDSIRRSTNPKSTPFLPDWYESIRVVFEAVREPAFSGIIFFYLWATLHTYRILDPTRHLSFSSFYMPKFAIIVPYVLFKALGPPSLRLYLSEIPLMSMLVWARRYHVFRVWNALRSELLYSIGAAIMELVLIAIIVTEAVTTNRVLRRAKYMKCRPKQIGFRFFAYLNCIFYAASSLLHVIVSMSLPNGAFYIPLFTQNVYVKETTDWQIGPSVLLLGYAVTEAYVKLPKEALGAVKGWFMNSQVAPSSSRWSRTSRGSAPSHRSPFDDDDDAGSRLLAGDRKAQYLGSTSSNDGSRAFPAAASDRFALDGSSKDGGLLEPASETDGSEMSPTGTASTSSKKMPKFLVDHDSELDGEIAEPVRYRKRERGEQLELRANSFTMDTHVMMFNFAWYVYYYGTPKAKKVNPADAARFHVFAHVSEPATDTHALVVDTIDRIVVSFKGTTSMRNMQTSIQIYHERLAGVVPTNIDGVDETARLEDLFGRSYAQAKVHKGFAVAYRSVAPQVMTAVQQLLVRKRRPVFLTGHSLGGALATLCSLDVWIKLGLSRREISVSTFGSPRVGNDAFRHIYKSTVPLHWRIVVIPDVVTKHPKGGYKHVGKKVTLTRYGRMLIDPNVLEQLHWSSKSASFAYHRKASYMLAMRAWCVRNHGKSYVPEFWPFPVSGDDKKRFQSALEPADMDTVAAPRAMVPSRIIELDAMVDALGARDDDAQLDMSVVDLWGRLARRALLNETLAR